MEHPLGKPGGAKPHNGGSHLFRGFGGQEEEVPGGVPQLRKIPLVYPVGVHHNQAFLSLAENLRQPDGRNTAAAEHIPEGETRPHGRQLIRVAYQNQTAVLGNGLQKSVEQGNVHHGHLIHNHHLGLQGIGAVPEEEHIPGVGVNGSLQQPMDGGSLLPRDLRQPLAGPSCGGGQKAFKPHLLIKGQNTVDHRGFAGAGAAGDNQKPGGGGVGECL